MSPVVPIEQACYWLALHPAREPMPLVHDDTAEVAIVGAGFTGLWTAIWLRTLDPARDIAILEGGSVAYGASGRNAGILTDTIDHSHALAIEHFGDEEARRLAALGRHNLAELIDFVRARNIDCDLENTGVLTPALCERQVAGLEASLACAQSLGVNDWQLLSRAQMRAQIDSELYHAALFNPAGCVLDPHKLALGLADLARSLGIRIFERSGVTGIEREGDTVRLETERGLLRAKRCVLGTSAYTHRLIPSSKRRFIPLYDYVLVSEPLSSRQRRTIGWTGRQGVNDARSFFNYYRLTADDRVLWGTSEAAYFPPNRVDPSCDHSEPHYAELRASFVRHFPGLTDLEFPYAWGGAICATTRFTPYFASAHGGLVHYALGYTGHGLGTTFLAGKILAHRVLDQHSPLLDLRLVRQLPFPYPPEPVRRWAVGQVTRALRLVDAGHEPNLLLRCLDSLGIGLSS